MMNKEKLLKLYNLGLLTGHEIGCKLVGLGETDFKDLPEDIVKNAKQHLDNLSSGNKLNTFSIIA